MIAGIQAVTDMSADMVVKIREQALPVRAEWFNSFRFLHVNLY